MFSIIRFAFSASAARECEPLSSQRLSAALVCVGAPQNEPAGQAILSMRRRSLPSAGLSWLHASVCVKPACGQACALSPNPAPLSGVSPRRPCLWPAPVISLQHVELSRARWRWLAWWSEHHVFPRESHRFLRGQIHPPGCWQISPADDPFARSSESISWACKKFATSAFSGLACQIGSTPVVAAQAG